MFQKMKTLKLLPIALAFTLAATLGSAFAQNAPAKTEAPATRAQVKMDTAEFMKTHRWEGENWVLKSDVEAPAGVKSRADVKADTTKFLSLNRWDQPSESWIPVKGKPRDMSLLTRAQVRAETVQFHRTHEIDDTTQDWVDKPVTKSMKK